MCYKVPHSASPIPAFADQEAASLVASPGRKRERAGWRVILVAAMVRDRLSGDEHSAAMALKYVWWQPAESTLADRRLLLAQMMTLGTVDDVRWLLARVSEAELRRVLHDPPVGVFNRRSWSFWRHRLGLDPAADLPARRLPPRLPR